MDQIFTLIDGSLHSNHTFIASHYPSSTTFFGESSDGRTKSHLLASASLFMCGHLHQLFAGLGNKLHGLHRTEDTLEIELGDMKIHKMFRIIVVDHDLISFRDFKAGDLEIPVMITNPKDFEGAMPSKEPLQRIRKSTHIRFMVFNSTLIASIDVFVDGFKSVSLVERIDKSMWAIEWQPFKLDQNKTHTIGISVKDIMNVTGSHTIRFNFQEKSFEPTKGVGENIILSNLPNMVNYNPEIDYFYFSSSRYSLLDM